MNYNRLIIVLGDQLFHNHTNLGIDENSLLFMAEDFQLCTHYKYHKHKLVLFLSAMRQHADKLGKRHSVKYHKLTEADRTGYIDKLRSTLKEHKIDKITTYEISDRYFQDQLTNLVDELNISWDVVATPGFLFPAEDFKKYRDQVKKPFMHTYYQRQRKKLDVLMEGEKPVGGKWSFDDENRKKLPKGIDIPKQPQFTPGKVVKEVMELVEHLFADHPGNSSNFGWATTRGEALTVLDHFFEVKFESFGPYEDAIHSGEAFIFHSTISPYLNCGLLTPAEVLEKAREYYLNKEIHYPSVEGFVRQIMGWREFLRGMYLTEDMQKNHFNHTRKLTDDWWEATTGIPPVDDTIKKAIDHGYTHHIERLMVMGNMMLLCEIHPDEVYRWFMEMYIDSAEWVMVPNVYGMSQFADGGSFATKPYIGGSNYILKMSNYKKGEWCDIWNGLYWRFIDVNKETFAKNQRMSMMVRTLEKMADDKKEALFHKAEDFIDKVTC